MILDETKGLEQFAKPWLLFLFWSVFLTSQFLILLATTDLFSHKPKGPAALWIIVAPAYWSVFKFTLFYIKVKKTKATGLTSFN